MYIPYFLIADLYEFALLDISRHPGVDSSESNGITANPKSAPFFADGLGQPDDTSLGSRVVRLASIAVQARSRGHLRAIVSDLADGSTSSDSPV